MDWRVGEAFKTNGLLGCNGWCQRQWCEALDLDLCASGMPEELIIGLEDQLWLPAGSDSIINNYLVWEKQGSTSDFCVDLTNENLTDGNQDIRLKFGTATRTTTIKNGTTLLAVTNPKSFVISLEKNPSLYVAASAPTANPPVVIEPCTPDSSSQTWSDSTNTGQISIFDNLCMAFTGSLNSGDKVILTPCVGNANEWGTGGGVLDLTDENKTSGDQLQIWISAIFTGTTENTNQEWIVTDTF
ncbi:hypothetical protein B0H19DRAFT_1059841 [Mycena capillaripes]|nr:hypothetical protein B0H19DRAFT_1059841 [Mycena capillaripes]